MRILVACEESQAVCKAFRAKGHEAYSCDIEPCSGGHPEWHIQKDVLPLLNGFCSFKTMDEIQHKIDGHWDMIIAFVPCTYTSNAGARHLWKGKKLNIERYYKGLCGKALFLAVQHADCPVIVIENPTPSKIFDYPPPTQYVQPFWFGDPWSKKTGLWIKGKQPLVPTKMVEPDCNCHEAGTLFMKGGKERQMNRSKTPLGLANAMAEQWG